MKFQELTGNISKLKIHSDYTQLFKIYGVYNTLNYFEIDLIQHSPRLRIDTTRESMFYEGYLKTIQTSLIKGVEYSINFTYISYFQRFVTHTSSQILKLSIETEDPCDICREWMEQYPQCRTQIQIEEGMILL